MPKEELEKEAEEIMMQKVIKENDCIMTPCKTLEDCQLYDFCFDDMVDAFKDGANFGYNKANEWHNINDIEPSKEQFGKHLLIRIESVFGNTDYDYLVYKYKGESITDVAGVLAWKEIE